MVEDGPDRAARIAAGYVEAGPADPRSIDAAVARYADGAAAWPGIRADPERFGRRLRAIADAAAAAAESDDADAAAVSAVAAADVRAADLYLASACLDGDHAAHTAFERHHVDPVRATLVRAGYDRDLVDDAIQTLRYRLLVATPERDAKLGTYRGRGSLTGWLRVVALRQARALLGPRPARSDSVDRLAGDPRDLELAVLGHTHGATLRRLLRAAVAALDDRARTVLRLEIVDGVPHQRIADLYGVHRSTVVRWIEDARQHVARAVRRGLRTELALGDSTAESLLRSLAGRVELSIASALT